MSNNSYNVLRASSFLDANNLTYIEDLYDQYLYDPQSVTPALRNYFEQLPSVRNGKDISLAPVREYFLQLARQTLLQTNVIDVTSVQQFKQQKVNELITAYRNLGHRITQIDPLRSTKLPNIPELELSYYGLTITDLNVEFNAYGFVGLNMAPLKTIIAVLKATYCGTLGIEFMHISDTNMRCWVQQNFEKNRGKINLNSTQQKRILERLSAAEGWERYIATKFVGHKRFSIEGADSLIPMLDFLLKQAAICGVQETVIGMSHRGRLNVLVNVMGKPAQELFAQFAGKKLRAGSGDVKYHEGFSAEIRTENGNMQLALAFNPSHLESVTPVIEGSVYAKQFRRGEQGRQEILPVAIHGDAAFAGQGVVAETLNLSQVQGYKTGGTFHIVINNQVGFTTDPIEARSTLYCTDIAKGFELPIFHVNGDDPESCILAVQLALEFRTQFQRDVVIELVCYRRFGHNEADEPAVTQPLMYRLVRELPTTRALYAQHLIATNVITSEAENNLLKQYREQLDTGQNIVDLVEPTQNNIDAAWTRYLNQPACLAVNTAVPLTVLQALAKKLINLPPHFNLQPQVAKMMAEREKMASGQLPLDWGFAETLAYATLAAQGHAVRISGQDSQRGTFAHRHAVLHDIQTGAIYMPLAQVQEKQAPVTILNSILSEFAVLAFEYGYAAASPQGLTIWEAQFGDFANGAQVIIDQFISTAEQKWGRLNGLVLLLPHGYEGQGPEHSSARLERFLQLCAQDNMSVCTPTTPAQTFHMLRRQVVGPVRKPLIVMMPKSLLRHKLAVSSLQDLAIATFQLVIPEVDTLQESEVKRVIFCAGKVYYDLLQKRRELAGNGIAIVRVEQVYPFPSDGLKTQLQRYKQANEIIWCQEEPKNQGAWSHVQPYLLELLTTSQKLLYIGRPATASTASGYMNIHAEELQLFLTAAIKF